MADRSFHLEIVTPDRALYAGEVTSVVAPGAAGSLGVLANHAPMIATLGPGEFKLREPSRHERGIVLSGGIFEVSKNTAIVLADGGEAGSGRRRSTCPVPRRPSPARRSASWATSPASTGTAPSWPTTRPRCA